MILPQLAHLADAHCSIESLGSGSHPALVVGAYDARHKRICNLFFYLPIYLEMPTRWIGAAFEIAENSELEEYGQQIWSNTLNIETLLKFYRLYKVQLARNDGTSTFVKIIALSLKIVEPKQS